MPSITEEKVVMYDSDEAAELITVKVWKSRSGTMYHEKSESLARYDGCTHRPCQKCGKPAEKHYTACRDCRAVSRAEAWANLPEVEWDGKTPLCEYDGDRFFFDPDDLYYYYDEEIDPDTVMLVVCEPDYGPSVDSDLFADCTPEDHETADQQHPEIAEAMKKLNELIHKNGPYCWWPGKKRINVKKWITTD